MWIFILFAVVIGVILILFALNNMHAFDELHEVIFRSAILNEETKKILVEETYSNAKAFLINKHYFSEEQAEARLQEIIEKDKEVGLKSMYAKQLN